MKLYNYPFWDIPKIQPGTFVDDKETRITGDLRGLLTWRIESQEDLKTRMRIKKSKELLNYMIYF